MTLHTGDNLRGLRGGMPFLSLSCEGFYLSSILLENAVGL